MKKKIAAESRGVSRRTLLTTAVAGLAVSPAAAAVKVSKASVGFRDRPGGDHVCGTCAQYAAPSECRFVEGAVSKECGCKIWTAKAV